MSLAQRWLIEQKYSLDRIQFCFAPEFITAWNFSPAAGVVLERRPSELKNLHA